MDHEIKPCVCVKVTDQVERKKRKENERVTDRQKKNEKEDRVPHGRITEFE